MIGSGGGMRAVGGMCGAMIGLDKFLDLVMYTAGVSGSSWYVIMYQTNYAYSCEMPDANSLTKTSSLTLKSND